MAVAFVNTNTAISSTSAATLSAAQTVSAGSNLCAVCWVIFRDDFGDPTSLTSVTLDGVAMVSAGAQQLMGAGGSTSNMQAFTQINPTVGAPTLLVTGVGTMDYIGAVVNVYQNVDQTTPIRAGSYTAVSTTSGAGGAVTNTIPSATNDMTVNGIDADSFTVNITGTQTPRSSDFIAGAKRLRTDDMVGAASNAHAYDTDGAPALIILIGWSLQQVTAGGPTTPQIMAAVGAHTAAGGMFGRRWR